MARKKGPSRAERWESATAAAREALESLRELQEEYQDWRDNLPENLDASPTAELLDEVLAVDIDGALATLDEADNLILPLGFGRD